MRPRLHWWRNAFFLVVGLLAALQIYGRSLLYMYRPACGGWLEDPIDAPLRPLYADSIARWMTEERQPFRRSGDDIHLAALDVYPWFDWVSSRHDFFLNYEIKFAASVASGQAWRDEPNPVPPAVQRLIARREAETGTRLQRNAQGYITYEAALRLPNCDLKRAALTLADDTPEERAASGAP